MIQEYDVGMPLQIVRDKNTEVIDLKIVDRTFSKLLMQSNNSKFKPHPLTILWLDSKILAIHLRVEEEKMSQKS